MTGQATPGSFRQRLAAFGRTLASVVLGRAAPSYLEGLAGGDEYWDRVVAAQRGWPQSRDKGKAPK